MRRVVPRLTVVRRVTIPHQGPEDVPVQTLSGVVIGIEQTIGAVVPHAVIYKAAARVASLVRSGIAGINAGIDDFQVQWVVAQDGGEPRGGLGAGGRGLNAAHLAIRPRGIHPPVGGPRGIPRVGVGVANVPPGEGNAGDVGGLLERAARRRRGGPHGSFGGLVLGRANVSRPEAPTNEGRTRDDQHQQSADARRYSHTISHHSTLHSRRQEEVGL